MSPKGLAILGSGIFAKEAHLPSIAALPEGTAELRAIYSRSEKSATELATAAHEVLGASPQVYHDGAPNAGLDALLARTDIDAVIVALPISVQPDIVRRALAAGKHVLSEKPVAKDVASGIALIKDYDETYRPKKLVWRVAENYEVETGYLRAGAVIRSGKIGKVGFYNVRVVNHVPKDSKWYNTPWRTIPDYQGGFLLDGGVHTAAALRMILPSPIVSLSGYASLNQEHLPPHDTINAAARSEDGSHGLIELTFGAPQKSRSVEAHNNITVTGDRGWLQSETDYSMKPPVIRTIVNWVSKDNEGRDAGEEKETFNDEIIGVKSELVRFLKAIDGEDDGFGKPFDTLKDVAFIQAGLNSNGSPVDLVKLVQG